MTSFAEHVIGRAFDIVRKAKALREERLVDVAANRGRNADQPE
jgi:hypothetical protein